jgi:hypothetical protein
MRINTKALAVILAVILVAMLAVACQTAPAPQSDAPTYASTVYFPPGGDQLVVASGGEIVVQSGATLDLQSGSTTTIGSYSPVWSAPITISGVLTNVRILYYQVP